MSTSCNVIAFHVVRGADVLAAFFQKDVEVRTRSIIQTAIEDVISSSEKGLSTVSRKIEGGHELHLKSVHSAVVAVTVKTGYPNRLSLKLLTSYGDSVQAEVGQTVDTAAAGSLTKPLKSIHQNLVKLYENPKEADKLAACQARIDATKGIMTENVRKILENTENINELSEKAESMEKNANAFSSQTVKLHNALWWKNMYCMGVILLSIVLLIAIILIPVVKSFS